MDQANVYLDNEGSLCLIKFLFKVEYYDRRVTVQENTAETQR